VRASERAPSSPFRVLERRHRLAEIVERGGGVAVSAAFNYATSLGKLKHYKQAKVLLLRNIPVARRVLGEGHKITLKMRWTYATALYMDPAATLDDLREAVATLEDAERTARRVFGGAHPHTKIMEHNLPHARAELRAREASG